MHTLFALFRMVFIGLCACTMLLQTRLVLGIPLTPGFLDGLVLGGTVWGYFCTTPDGLMRISGWWLGFMAGLCFLFWLKSGGHLAAGLVPVIAWLAYYGFTRPGNAGLRSWLLAKPLTVAFVWAWVTVFLPVS